MKSTQLLIVLGLVAATANSAQAQRSRRVPPAGAGDVRGPSKPVVGFGGQVRLKDLPEAARVLGRIGHDLSNKEHRISLRLGGEYMVNKCLGIKVITGELGLRLPPPHDPRTQGNTVSWNFTIDRIALYGLRVRVRPNPGHVTRPCTFGKALDVGGSASNVQLDLRFDPLLDLKQCRLLSVGMVRPTWRIGGLNLKPLQNDLDKVAKQMIEEALTIGSEMALGGPIQASINSALRIVGGECKVIAEGRVTE